jgi:hypothetical protein
MQFSKFSRRKPVGIAALALLACVAFGPNAAANEATSGYLTATQIEIVRANMTDAGIPASSQAGLIATLNGGNAIESQISSSIPLSNFTEQRDGFTRNVSVFSDGSRRWTEQQNPTKDTGLATRAINPQKSECSYSGGWYNNCKIGISDAVSNASFRIDYTTNKVRDYRGAGCNNSVGSCSVSGGIKRATAGTAGPAWAEMQFHANVGPIVNVANGAFGIRVQGLSVSLYGS